MEFKLAYIGNDNYQDYVAERMMRARRGRRDIPADKSRSIIVDGLVKFIVRDWKGLTNEGDPFGFTTENAKTLLLGSAIIRDFIVSEANNIENFGGAEPEKDEEDREDSPAGDLKSGVKVAA